MANPKIQLRHDTAANWTSVNPVLLEGEVGIETDTRKQKFGDGVTAWNSLPYDMGSTALQSDSIVTPLSYRASGISTTVIGSIDSDGYLNGTTSSVEAEFVPETTVASQIIFNDVFSFNSHSAWTNDAMLDVVFSEPFTVGDTTSDTLSLYVTRYGTIYFIIGDNDYIYSAELIGGSGTYDSEINLILTFTDSGDNWTIGTGVTNFDGSTWKYGNSSGTCIFNRIGTSTATIPKTAKIKEFILYNSTQSRMDTINTSVQIGTTIYTINSDSAGLKLSYNSDNLKVNNNNQLDTVVELSELATQNWVTNQGYLTAITSSNVTNALGYTPVNKAGDTMSGGLSTTYLNTSNNITLGGAGRMYLKVSGTSKGTTPSSNSYQAFLFNDSDSSHTTWQSQRFGACEMQVLNTGENRLILSAYKNEANSTAGGTLTLGVLSNGRAYCTFPNTTCCDGQWTNTSVQLANNVSLPVGTDQEITYDLSSALPNDSYKYEVVLSYAVQTGNSSGAGLSANIIGSGDSIWHRICDTYARGSWYMVVGGNVVVTVGAARTIKFKYIAVSKAGQLNYLYIEGYRRIGTNA